MRALSGPRPRVAMLSTAAILLLAGCAASQLGNMWRDSKFKTDGFKNVLVIAVRNDPVRRRMWEDGFVNGLAAYGVTATQSYEIWANALPDTQTVRDEVRKDGFDAVLVNERPPSSAQLTWVQGYSRRESVTRYDPNSGAASQKPTSRTLRASAIKPTLRQQPCGITASHKRLCSLMSCHLY